MTAYNSAAVTNTVIAYKKSITLQLARALRDNPLAMFEGAVGAPRLQFAALDAWYSTADAVGTYMFARYTGGADVSFGATVAGSDLRATSAAYRVQTTGLSGESTFTVSASRSGTWLCMGYFDHVETDSSMTIYGATLWLRIA